ncbi:MAG: hypothetical protein JXQ75_07070 [Phycisphaerae bacterium]|nr:hypothetical protein [Phycisphaerae bacterium]
MVLAVPPGDVDALLALAKHEDVEATVIGRFSDTGRLIVRYDGTEVGNLDVQFLHHGLPKTARHAEWWPDTTATFDDAEPSSTVGSAVWRPAECVAELKRRLAEPSTASKHQIIRQYDHEVQAGSVIKPLVGAYDGPSDAAVIRPRLDSDRGIAIGCGLAPRLADIDPYWMAVAAVDEALRNVVCVGGDPAKTAILDNFCWPRVDDPRSLGALVRACQACHDVAKAYGLPFISGKDSLNNEFAMNDADATALHEFLAKKWPHLDKPAAAHKSPGRESPTHNPRPSVVNPQSSIPNRQSSNRLAIPYTLLISAVSLIDDVNRCIAAAPRPVNGEATLFYCRMAATGWPAVDLDSVARLHRKVGDLVRSGAVVAAHDCSEGGPAVAVAEMALATGLETRFLLAGSGPTPDPFAEPPSGYILQAADLAGLHALTDVPGIAVTKIARMCEATNEPAFRFVAADSKAPRAAPLQPTASASLPELRYAWSAPLDW